MIEVGIDLTALIGRLADRHEGKGRVFVRMGTKEDSAAEGVLEECAVRTYSSEGHFLAESALAFAGGDFGKNALQLSGTIDLKAR